MPKKDTATAVLGMLSTVGAQTRVTAPVEEQAPQPAAPAPAPAPVATEPPVGTSRTPRTALVSTLAAAAAAAATATGDPAPRTIRLRSDTAAQLRAAWLEAKRDDVLLQAQDFASTLVEEALNRRRRSRAASSS